MCCTFVTYNPKFPLLVEAINVEFPFHISELLFLYRKAVGFLNRILCIPNCCSHRLQLFSSYSLGFSRSLGTIISFCYRG